MLRTDLAVESAADLKDDKGVKREVETGSGMHICRMDVISERAAKELGKPRGRYVTLSRRRLFENSQDFSEKARQISEELRAFLPEHGTVLVAGLGNRDITPDALGPLVADGVLSTRHFKGEAASSYGLDSLRGVAVSAPGVLGQTGMETAELLSALCERIRPDAVIAVDALAARDLSRLTTTVQISGTGICPGAGVQNRRTAVNREVLGVPVIALGVPTVVDAVTMAQSVFSLSESEIARADREAHTMMVTTRDIDTVIRRAASLLSLSVNLALQPELSEADILFLNS